MENKKSGFIAVIGAPNAGKSTFVNKMVGEKIAIVTPKVQTTRNNILGITIENKSQLIFVDTPGIFTAKANFEKSMVQSAFNSVAEADIIAVLIDSYKGLCDNSKIVLKLANEIQTTKKIVIFNKIDKVDKSKLLNLANEVSNNNNFEQFFMVSALKNDGLNDVKTWISNNLPNDEWHFPEDQITDIPLRQWASEVTRESLFYRLNQELPYSVTVETESWEEKDKYIKAKESGKTIKQPYIAISQIIYVQNENQKKIILGKNGVMLKQVGIAARTHIEKFLNKKTHLSLFVKVEPNWKEDKRFYHQALS